VTYAIEFTPGAERDIDALPAKVRPVVGAAIAALAETPLPPGSAALKSTLKGSYRLRVGDYRVGYQADHKAGIVTVWQVGRRGKFYEKATRRKR
jgi:mRNA-degrading endonuclease RelE of RelBE toxin-antitoxin system